MNHEQELSHGGRTRDPRDATTYKRTGANTIGGKLGFLEAVMGSAAVPVEHWGSALAREAWQRAEERDRAWFNAEDLLCVLAPDGKVRSANPAWATRLAWRPEEVTDQPLYAFIDPDDRDVVKGALNAGQSGCLPRFEARCLHKDGTGCWFSWVASVDAGLIYARGRDISAEKAAAVSLARSDALLQQSQKMEAIGYLTGGIAHGFNNLLQAVSGILETLGRRHVWSDAGHKLIAQAAEAIERGATLTRQLLAFAREQQLAPRTIDLNVALRDSRDLITNLLGDAPAVDWQLCDDLWPAMVDPGHLDIALINLLLNARDALVEGGTITVATRNLDASEVLPADLAPGAYLVLSVADTGVGMTEAVRSHAFEPFFTTKGIGGGSGLGLSQVYGFAKQSGGTAQILSTPGAGTIVEIFLPRAPAWALEQGEPKPVPTHGRGTMLVVDDDIDVRELTADYLKDCGYSVLVADSGQAALDLLEEHKADLLLVDFAMPGMNGAEVVRRARLIDPALRVVFMTGYADVDALTVHAPPQDILRKPFRFTTLNEQISKVMSRSVLANASRRMGRDSSYAV
jgi:PAS domain S-box-containing protein